MHDSPDVSPELDEFWARALPTLLRRFRFWNGLCPNQHADILADLEQDLLLDCLEHPQTIRELPTDERHRRWFRLLEQRHYRLRIRDRRRQQSDCVLEELVDGQTSAPEAPHLDLLPSTERGMALRVIADAEWLKNGRLNACGTARRLGIRGDEIRSLWERSAAHLGFDSTFLLYWRQRLIEALVALAADLLVDAGAFGSPARSCGEPLRAAAGAVPRPDPKAQLRRIRRIRAQMSIRPIPPAVRSVLARFAGRTSPTVTAREALDAARSLEAGHRTVAVWSMEEARHRVDRAAFQEALRHAHRCGVPGIELALARIRWHQDTGASSRATRLMHRCATKFQGEPAMRQTLATGRPPPPRTVAPWRPAQSTTRRRDRAAANREVGA